MRTFILVLFCGISAVLPAAAAELTAAQIAVVKKIGDAVTQAGTKYQAGDYEAAGKSVASAMDQIDAAMIAGGPDLFDAIAPAFSRIRKAHALLELEGVTVRPFVTPTRPTAAVPKPATAPVRPAKKPVEPANPLPTMPSANPFSAGVESTSFVKTIAPILLDHCGKCHVAGSKGEFSMATFRMLAKGTPAGTVIFPGDVQGSRLIDTIETGDMPRGGGKVPPAQLKLLKDWIAGGAKFDGPSPDAPLTTLVSTQGAPPAAPAPTGTVKRATGNETVSFSKDIAPILLKNCNGCHIDAMQDRGGLRMDNFAQILKGGDSGAIVEGGKSVTSLLIRKLKGEAGDRMPAGGRPPLSEESITLISRWIDEGAALDGDNANQPLRVMSALAWAKSATDQELSERRANQAADNLKLVTGQAPRSAGLASDHFLIVGDSGEGTVKAVSDAAAKAWTEIRPWVELAGIRGRITIFVMSKRYDYSEFAKMVEQRSVPGDWQSHWSHDGIDAYVAMVASSDDTDESLKAKLVGPLASLAVAMRAGGVPRWFAEGVGRVTASKVVLRDLPAIEMWNRDLPSAFSAMKDGQQFIKNELPPEQSDLIAYGIVSAMMSRTQRRQYDTLLRTMPTADSFESAFEQTFGVAPAEYITRLKQYAGR